MFEVRAPGGNVLRGECSGSGPVVLQAHGITAARGYVTHGSRVLERAGFTSARYDARGHGESDPAPEGEAYSYGTLAGDMGATAEHLAPEGRLVVAGHSMGAHTAAAFALAEPEKLAGLVLIGPVSLGEPAPQKTIDYWNRLADGLDEGGVEGFVKAYDDGSHRPDWREVVLGLARRRLALHRDLGAVARALREVPGSLPFEGAGRLEELDLPVLVVASRDEADPGHPRASAEEWTERIGGARMIIEPEGESPLAWQGGKLSREIATFCAEDAVRERLGA
jgi:pimeloyl-ACP methyl ester carboxylesterase